MTSEAGRGSVSSERPMDDGERAARDRLRAFFAEVNRLTPDELARIGYSMPPDAARQPLLQAIDEAAARTGRVALVGEARDVAREAVLYRYAVGTYRPTFIALNWGISSGSIADRVAIAETLADAAAAAVVEDVLDPEVASALALEAASITGLAAGEAYEGSLDHVVRTPDDPDLRPSGAVRAARNTGFALLIGTAALSGFGSVLSLVAFPVFLVRAMIRAARGSA